MFKPLLLQKTVNLLHSVHPTLAKKKSKERERKTHNYETLVAATR